MLSPLEDLPMQISQNSVKKIETVEDYYSCNGQLSKHNEICITQIKF